MTQHHRIVCGGLFFFFTVAHAGCAGSGLKNLFTRNETDGYHSLDELNAEKQAIVKTEKSDGESKPASVAARLTSWRPFSKVERGEEDTDTADGHKDAKDYSESGKSTGLLSRAFAKGDAVDPDPFLELDSASMKRAEKPAFKTGSDPALAKIDNDTEEAASKLKNTDDEFTVTPDRKNKSTQYPHALASADSGKTDSLVSENEDDALAKRFEQHFLLNTDAKADSKLTTTTKNRQDNTAGVPANANSKRRDLSSIAERQIDSFDSHMKSSDSISDYAGFKRTAEAESLGASHRRDSTLGAAGHSLTAFDSLMGTEGNVATRNVMDAADKITHTPEVKTAAMDIDVADATSLFGAAIARQNAREKKTETVEGVPSAGSEIADNGAGTQANEDGPAFHWNDPRDAKRVSRANARNNASNPLARREQANLNSSQGPDPDSAFDGPSGDIEGDDYSVVETAAARLSPDSAYGGNRRTATTASGSPRPRVVIMPASSESTVGDNPHSFAAAPLASGPESDSGDRVTVASNRPGLLQSLSTRNWLLLIGGIIVIALLFAPGRTKHATMTNRPANG